MNPACSTFKFTSRASDIFFRTMERSFGSANGGASSRRFFICNASLAALSASVKTFSDSARNSSDRLIRRFSSSCLFLISPAIRSRLAFLVSMSALWRPAAVRLTSSVTTLTNARSTAARSSRVDR